MSEYYDPDHDARHQSPLLEAVRPKATPSPSPPPFVTPQATKSPPQNANSPSSRRRGKPKRRKTRPSQGDFVLIRVMEPNRPDIARLVGERALNSASDSGSEASDEEMEDRSVTAEPAPSEPLPVPTVPPGAPAVDLQATAQKALDTRPAKYPPPFQRDSVVEIDIPSHPAPEGNKTASRPLPAETLMNSTPKSSDGVESQFRANDSSQPDARSPRSRAPASLNGYPHDDSIAASPNIGQHTIPQSRRSPSQTLPALQPPHSPLRDGPGSPNQERRLPSFRHLSELAETAINNQETSRTKGFPHRHSISSSTHSPTSVTRQLSISSARSPVSAFPATSPISGNGEPGPRDTRDIFLRSGQSHLTLFSPRRPSQASDNSPYSATLNSASTSNDSYPSSDGISPGTLPTPVDGQGHRMSIDGALTSRTLPPPNCSSSIAIPKVQHIPSHYAVSGFKCDYPGCISPPFQTQYLLK